MTLELPTCNERMSLVERVFAEKLQLDF
jgi:hypothetical protein